MNRSEPQMTNVGESLLERAQSSGTPLKEAPELCAALATLAPPEAEAPEALYDALATVFDLAWTVKRRLNSPPA